MVTPGALTLDPSKPIDLIILDALWKHQALGNLLTSIVSNSRFGKRHGAQEITICGSHFVSHVTEHVFSDR